MRLLEARRGPHYIGAALEIGEAYGGVLFADYRVGRFLLLVG